MARLALTFFGAPHIQLGGSTIHIGRQKALALLAYLAVTQQPVTRARLAAMFWPDYATKAASTQLRQMLWALNKAIGKEWLLVEHDNISFAARDELWVDVHEYRQRGQALAATRRDTLPLAALITMADLQRADFLAGFTLADSQDFTEWQLLEAEALRNTQMRVLEEIVTLLTNQQEYAQAISFARRWLAMDLLNEAAHCRLMQLYHAIGQRGLVLRQYQECVQALQQGLGVPPAAETVALYRALSQEQGLLLPATARPVAQSTPISLPSPPVEQPGQTANTPPHNLPTALTPFIGREPELVQILARLRDPACRLLTLIGPGGIGKTRLALAAAQQIWDQDQHKVHIPPLTGEPLSFPDGVYFVPLADLTTVDRLALTVATTLHFTLYRREEDPFQQLLTYLADKRLLLVLDNFEHLLPGATQIKILLAQALGLKIVVTSRERLNIQGEWLLDVPGLAYPMPARVQPEITGQSDYSAIQLFVENARRVNANFVPDDENLPSIVRICTLVEGMPLALELAAAWLRLLSCAEIAAELEQSLTILTATQPDRPARHQSMRALFQYSWSLLTPAEQEVMRRLAVFQGGFRREAVQAIVAPQGASILPFLMALTDKSWLRNDGAGRFRMHELLRQFATEQLSAQPAEAALVTERQLTYFTTWLQKQGVHLRGRQQKQILAAINAEMENIRVAWQHALHQFAWPALEAALDTLAEVYELYGWFHEGATLFANALAQVQSAAGPNGRRFQGRLMARLGFFWQRLGQYSRAKQLLQEGYALLQASEASRELIYCLNNLGEIARIEGDYAAAEHALTTSIELSRRYDTPLLLARGLNLLGIVQGARGNYAAAQQTFRESLALYEQNEDQQGIAKTYNNLGILAYFAKDYPVAWRFYQGSLTINRELGHQYDAALALSNLGLVAQKQGNQQEAVALFQEALALERKIGYEMGVGLTLNDLSAIFLELGELTACEAHLSEVLQLAHKLQSTPLALAGLAVLADLAARKDEWVTAVRIARLVQSHPAAEEETRVQVAELLAQAQKYVSPAAFHQFTPSNPDADLRQLLDELLEQGLPTPAFSLPAARASMG